MSVNPYASPPTAVGGMAKRAVAPALWNPNAAASWSLLFTPAFGAFIHMKNWQTLGEPSKAASAKTWAVFSLVASVSLGLLGVFLTGSKGLGGASIGLPLIILIAWYFGSGQAQAQYVKERYGTSYPRRDWTTPLLIGFGLYLGYSLVFLALTFLIVILVRT